MGAEILLPSLAAFAAMSVCFWALARTGAPVYGLATAVLGVGAALTADPGIGAPMYAVIRALFIAGGLLGLFASVQAART